MHVWNRRNGLGGRKQSLARERFGRAVELGRKTGDKLIIGNLLDCLSYHTFWTSYVPEEQEEQRKAIEKSLRYAEDAKNCYTVISFVSPTKGPLWAESPQAEYYRELAVIEADLDKRRELLQKAAEASAQMLKLATDSGCPENILHAHHVFSKAFTSLAVMETDSENKKRVLESALEHRNKSLNITEQLMRFEYWDHGVMLSGLANTKRELAKLAGDLEPRRKMLCDAILDEENAVKLRQKSLALKREATVSMYTSLGNEQYKLGGWLDELLALTEDKECLKRSAQAFADAAESFQKSDMRSRVAECFWKAGRAYDDLGEHQRSAKHFDLAAVNYRKAAEKIPQFGEFYLDHAVYMQAWAEIEVARHHHARQEYNMASERFDRAAELHRSSRRWRYLATNYAAWAQVERAENLSREERTEEALDAFERATPLFAETKQTLQVQLARTEDCDEKEMVLSMAKATNLRLQYCTGRIALEEAKIFDKKGEHRSSSEKYGVAVETFEKISQNLPGQEEKEVRFITGLSKAWQKMTLAEAEASPALYREASELFESAKALGSNEETRMLVLGHSRFCKALEAGAHFTDTRDPAFHVIAVRHLESAADYYLRANFPKASEYVKATRALLDGYYYIDDAIKEHDPEKKTRLYVIAEKILQTSAGCFMKAEQPSKREQVLRLLDKVKEERELATSISEVLYAPAIIGTTASFAIPTPSREEAVGSARFENADLQANVEVRRKEVRIGETIDVKIELVNAGKAPALLIKTTGIAPRGFDLIEAPSGYSLEDNDLNMKGRRLDPMKTEEVRLTLKPRVQGVFSLRPTIMYLDENGKYKSHQPEPVTVAVRELGIKGWLKGER